MVKTRIFLTVSTLLSGIGSPLFVYAQSNTAPAVIKSDPEKHAEKNDGKKKNAADNVESIAVFGHGSTRQTMSIGRASMQQSVPGTSALKVLNELPGVLYQSADPFGVYEYSSQIFMRGFSQSQLGFTLDDVPLGDQQFNNYNGLGVTRAIISDNIGSVNVSQGAGGLMLLQRAIWGERWKSIPWTRHTSAAVLYPRHSGVMRRFGHSHGWIVETLMNLARVFPFPMPV